MTHFVHANEHLLQERKSTEEELLYPGPLLQVISIGDSEIERAALWAVKSERPDIIVKSVKLLEAPSIVDLRRQLDSVSISLDSICSSLDNLDLKLQPKDVIKPDVVQPTGAG